MRPAVTPIDKWRLADLPAHGGIQTNRVDALQKGFENR